jgi:hypothetical protein
MQVTVASADLEFLVGGSIVAARFPIRVIRAAKQRHDLLRAVPLFDQIPRWKAFRYERRDARSGSIFVTEDWRMDIRGEDSNEKPDHVSITAVRKVAA